MRKMIFVAVCLWLMGHVRRNVEKAVGQWYG